MTDNKYIYFADEEIEICNYVIKGNTLIIDGAEYWIKRAEPRGYYCLKK